MTLLGFTNWKDEHYEDIEYNDELDIAWDVTVQYMKAHGLRFTGEHHQYGERGAPYFDTGKKLCLSMRLGRFDGRGAGYPKGREGWARYVILRVGVVG